MKELKRFFAVLLVPLVFQAAFANDDIDTSRAATRRGATTTVSATRKKSSFEQSAPQQKSDTVSRTTGTEKNSGTVRSRTVSSDVSERSGGAQSITSRETTANKSQSKNVSARTTSTVQQRAQPGTNKSRVVTRSATSQKSTPARTTRNTNRSATLTRSGILSRNATDVATTAAAITSRNYSACKNVFFECMDEFCANKDTTLKRCACSSRINDFDRTKQQLSKVEDKLLDFSQRLLTVNMDKEDAMALNTATEGEIAYAVDDTSKSKKMLDEIAKKLNASFNNSNFDQGLNAISLSLDANAAFDSVDSLMGASTTTKSGVDLYNAALPVCREMALEVCTSEDLAIAESGYQMAIAQDCNTVEKSYETQNEQARAKILESSALLDMSRLDIHQKRNSDDILTCKKKMLDMLTDTTVCGANMSKCLDITGKYIDPSTGEAVLTEDLSELADLIVRPTGEQTWTKVPTNDTFVKFLNTKKIYLEPAMENCQDISSYVWDAFIEDALAQIKLAQDAKLEQVRQSCTTLTTQCLDDATKTINDFDARALSIFGVKADATINAMCTDIRNACTALMNETVGNTNTDGTTSSDWDTGMTEIAASKTYETILATCREVGKNCIIQSCSAISGNFGLCENIDTSINRKSIISRRACWAEVEQCVRDAGADTIAQIMKQNGREDAQTDGDIYDILYGIDINQIQTLGIDSEEDTQATTYSISENTNGYQSIHDWCNADLANSNATDFDWQVCRLTEQIWGNCEHKPSEELTPPNSNKIFVNYNASNNDNETLLSWFARNTGTEKKSDSCRDTTCGYNEKPWGDTCCNSFTTDGVCCGNSNNHIHIYDGDGLTNCFTNSYENNNTTINCRDSRQETTKHEFYAQKTQSATNIYTGDLCVPTASHTATLIMTIEKAHYYCISTNTAPLEYEDSKITCDGIIVKVENNIYTTPTTTAAVVQNLYYLQNAFTDYNSVPTDGNTCIYNNNDNNNDNNNWGGVNENCTTPTTTPTNWQIKYESSSNEQTAQDDGTE